MSYKYIRLRRLTQAINRHRKSCCWNSDMNDKRTQNDVEPLAIDLPRYGRYYPPTPENIKRYLKKPN